MHYIQLGLKFAIEQKSKFPNLIMSCTKAKFEYCTTLKTSKINTISKKEPVYVKQIFLSTFNI